MVVVNLDSIYVVVSEETCEAKLINKSYLHILMLSACKELISEDDTGLMSPKDNVRIIEVLADCCYKVHEATTFMKGAF